MFAFGLANANACDFAHKNLTQPRRTFFALVAGIVISAYSHNPLILIMVLSFSLAQGWQNLRRVEERIELLS